MLGGARFLLLLVPSGDALHVLFVVLFCFFLLPDFIHFCEFGIVDFDLAFRCKAVSVEVRRPVEFPVVYWVGQLSRDVLHVSVHFADQVDSIDLLLLEIPLKALHVLWVGPWLAAFDLGQEALMVWWRW